MPWINYDNAALLMLFSFLCCSIMYLTLTFSVPCCDIHYDFCIKTMFGQSLPPVVCRRAYLRYLCLFVFSGVKNILPFLFYFVFLRLVYPMLPFSLAYPFLITPSVFSNVYLSCVIYVAIFSGLSISDYPFCVL